MAKNKSLVLMLALVLMIACGGLASAVTAPSSIQPATGTLYENGQNDIVINATVAAGENVSSCLLTWVGSSPTGNPTSTMTNSSETLCTVTVSNIPDGSYEFYVTASNESATSAASSTISLTFDNQKSSPAAYLYATGEVSQEGEEDVASGNSIYLVGLLLLVIGYVALKRK